jgi:hypothetical protein
LTAKGNSIRMTLQPIVEELQQEILQPLKEADQERLISLIRQIVWSEEVADS